MSQSTPIANLQPPSQGRPGQPPPQGGPMAPQFRPPNGGVQPGMPQMNGPPPPMNTMPQGPGVAAGAQFGNPPGAGTGTQQQMMMHGQDPRLMRMQHPNFQGGAPPPGMMRTPGQGFSGYRKETFALPTELDYKQGLLVAVIIFIVTLPAFYQQLGKLCQQAIEVEGGKPTPTMIGNFLSGAMGGLLFVTISTMK